MGNEGDANGGEEEKLLPLKESSANAPPAEDGHTQEGFSVNGLSVEGAKGLLGRIEYHRGNINAALRIFDGIDLHAAIQQLQSQKSAAARSRGERSESASAVRQPVLEAFYWKAMSLRKLGKVTEAAKECARILEDVEKMYQPSIPDVPTVGRFVELLPELWKQAGCYHKALDSYRSALLTQWNLDDDCCSRIQKRFAVFLLHGGIETTPPSSQDEGSFVPQNNLEEAILLLMIVLRKFNLGKTQWDPSVMEHLSFALSVCNQTSLLARHFEEVMPGIYQRCDRWYNLALCYGAAGQNLTALNLLRKSLIKDESPNDIMSLLLAAKICSEDCLFNAEGVEYARRAVQNARASDEHLKSVGLRLLGICLGKQAKVASSDCERSVLQSEALKSLDEAIALERNNTDILFDLGLEYAEQSNTHSALRLAKEYIDATGGSMTKGWRLLALVLSAQQRYSEAEIVTDAALDETAKWEQAPLLRIKAKLKAAQSLPMDAVETYRLLLALVQAQKKSCGSFKNNKELEDVTASEFQVWLGLANLYASLSHWRDADLCLDKARELQPFSASVIHAQGHILESGGATQPALAAYVNGLATHLEHVPCKVAIGALLSKEGSKYLPVARSFISDVLRFKPTNRMAWYHLGSVHRDEGRLSDAADCFQAASLLEDADPIESYSSPP